MIEPALRDRARHLHRVRDELASGRRDDLRAVPSRRALPGAGARVRLVPRGSRRRSARLARPGRPRGGAAPRGLTFSYVVLHRGRTATASTPIDAPAGAARLRVVSGAIRTKGKREAFVCGELPGPDGPVAARARLMRLDRDETPGNAAWDAS